MFDWENFLTLAEDLAERNDESCQRSAVSRAYYAAFCSARNKLKDEGTFYPTGHGTDHGKVWKCFQMSSDKERRRIGNRGNSLKIMRGKVDYNNEVPRLPIFCALAPKRAREILSDLQTL